MPVARRWPLQLLLAPRARPVPLRALPPHLRPAAAHQAQAAFQEVDRQVRRARRRRVHRAQVPRDAGALLRDRAASDARHAAHRLRPRRVARPPAGARHRRPKPDQPLQGPRVHDQPARRLLLRRRVRGRRRAARVGRQARQLRLGGHDARLPRLEVRAPARARQHEVGQVQHAAAGAPGPRVLVWRVAPVNPCAFKKKNTALVSHALRTLSPTLTARAMPRAARASVVNIDHDACGLWEEETAATMDRVMSVENYKANKRLIAATLRNKGDPEAALGTFHGGPFASGAASDDDKIVHRI